MKKLLMALMVAVMASSFSIAPAVVSFAAEERKEVENRLELNNVNEQELTATGAVTPEIAKQIIELREQLGSFQNYGDLEELKIPKDQMEKLQQNTTIQGIASDCTC